jgi:hypothetical protein
MGWYAARDLVIFGLGWLAGAFIAYQIYLTWQGDIAAWERYKTRSRRRNAARTTAAGRTEAKKGKDAQFSERWKWN